MGKIIRGSQRVKRHRERVAKKKSSSSNDRVNKRIETSASNIARRREILRSKGITPAPLSNKLDTRLKSSIEKKEASSSKTQEQIQELREQFGGVFETGTRERVGDVPSLRERQNRLRNIRSEEQQRQFLEANQSQQQVIVPQQVQDNIPQGEMITEDQINPRTGLPYGTVTPVEEPEGFLGKLRRKADFQRGKVDTAIARGDTRIAESIALGAGTSLLSTAEFGKKLVLSPVDTITEAGQGIFGLATGQVGLPQVGQTLKTNPAFALGFAGAEVAQIGIIGKGLDKAGKFASTTKAKLSTKFKPVSQVDDIKIIKGIKTKSGKKVDIELASGTADVSEPLSKQAGLIGKKVDAVSGSQDLFGKIFKRKVMIDKPSAKGLEKSFFADPRTRLRASRIGLGQKDARVLDILSGDVTFKSTKPQAVLFEDALIQKLPANLKNIGTKLKAGKTLSTADEAKLLKFQLEPSGKFKPIGFLSRESEITLAPTEIIKSRGVIGKTVIKGRSVDIIQAEVAKASPKVTSLLGKAKTGNVAALKSLSKELGFSSMSSSASASTPFLSPLRAGASALPLKNLVGSRRTTANSSKITNIPRSFLSPPPRHLDPFSSSPTSIGKVSSVRSPIGSIPISSTPIIPSRSPISSPISSLSGSSPKIPSFKVTPAPVFESFNLPSQSTRKRKKKKSRGYSRATSLTIAPDLTSRALNLKQILKPSDLKASARDPSRAFLSKIPTFSTKTKKRRKKRK